MARWGRAALRVGRPFRLPVPEYLPVLRFHLPLIEPDVRICRIRLSDKGSHFRPRDGLSFLILRQVDQAQRGVQVLVRVA